MIFSLIMADESPLNGNLLKIMQYSIIPMPHMSIAGLAVVYCACNTSGAIYLNVPASFFSWIFPLHMPDIPKSTTFILDLALLSKITFSNFRSLWITPYSWQQSRAEFNYFMICLASISVRPFVYSTYSTSSPPSAYSIINTTSFLSTNAEWSLMIFLCLSILSILASL